MPVVLVHGNPESPAIWRPLLAELAALGIDDTVCLAPPGFGAPADADFAATPEAYVDWLATALGEIDGPIDILGHDWGAGHVMGLVAAHADLVRSYTIDIVGLLHPDYVWHDMAQVWQTPGAGEEAVAGITAASHDEKVALFSGLGLPADIADDVATAANDDMARCILRLYRGGAQPYLTELANRLATADRPPGLAVDATADPYVPSHLVPDVVERFGLTHLALADRGHWWMIEDPAGAAAGLADWWRSAASGDAG